MRRGICDLCTVGGMPNDPNGNGEASLFGRPAEKSGIEREGGV